MNPHDPVPRLNPIAQGLYGEESRTLEIMSLESLIGTLEQDCKAVNLGATPIPRDKGIMV